MQDCGRLGKHGGRVEHTASCVHLSVYNTSLCTLQDVLLACMHAAGCVCCHMHCVGAASFQRHLMNSFVATAACISLAVSKHFCCLCVPVCERMAQHLLWVLVGYVFDNQ